MLVVIQIFLLLVIFSIFGFEKLSVLVFIQLLVAEEIWSSSATPPHMAFHSLGTSPDCLKWKGHKSSARIGPCIVKAILLGLAKILLVFRLVECPTSLDNPKDLQGNVLVLVAKTREKVWEDVRLQVHLVCQGQQPVTHRLIPESSHCWVPVEGECRHIVDLSDTFIEGLDLYLVRVLPSHEYLKDLKVMLPHATYKAGSDCLQGRDAQLGMIVRETGHERSCKRLSEVQQHLMMVVTESYHCLAG
mmetsp:Transcript_74078/g.130961  ORF Transcript_74078/g.130961 Transcript_74078/m.130961 type:complete len:246 (+) Transcript_74078:2584-3321(+)